MCQTYQRHDSISEDENVTCVSVVRSLYKLLVRMLALTRISYNEICGTRCSAGSPLPRSITAQFSWKDMPDPERRLRLKINILIGHVFKMSYN